MKKVFLLILISLVVFGVAFMVFGFNNHNIFVAPGSDIGGRTLILQFINTVS